MKLIKVSKVEYLYIRKNYPHLLIHAKWGLRNLRVVLEFEKFGIRQIYNSWYKGEYENIKKYRIAPNELLRRLGSQDFNYFIYPRQCGKTYEYYRKYFTDEIFDYYKRFIMQISEVDKVNKNERVFSSYIKQKFLEELITIILFLAFIYELVNLKKD